MKEAIEASCPQSPESMLEQDEAAKVNGSREEVPLRYVC